MMELQKKEARRFLCDNENHAIVPVYYYAHLINLHRMYENAETGDELEAQITQLITKKLHYNTTLNDIREQYESTQKEEINFWQGVYTLFDKDGQRFVLKIGKSGVMFNAQHIEEEDYDFEDTILSFEAEEHTVSLQFSTFDRNQLAEDQSNLDQLMSEGKSCAGTVQTEEISYQVKGKRGVFTLQGYDDLHLNDPIGTWVGAYNVVKVSEDTVVYHDEPLLWIKTDDPQKAICQFHGKRYIFEQEKGFMNQYLWKSEDETSNIQISFEYDTTNTGKLALQFTEGKITSLYTGIWAGPLTAAEESGVSVSNSRSKRTLLGAQGTDIKGFPLYLVKNTRISHQLEGSDDQATYSDWSLSGGTLPKDLTLSANGELKGGLTDLPGDYDLKIAYKKTQNSQTSDLEEDVTIKVVEKDIEITTTQLHQATVGQDYKAVLRASGGDGQNYEWTKADGPDWVNIDTNGNISVAGSALQEGMHTLTVQMTNSTLTAKQNFTIHVVLQEYWLVTLLKNSGITAIIGVLTAIIGGFISFKFLRHRETIERRRNWREYKEDYQELQDRFNENFENVPEGIKKEIFENVSELHERLREMKKNSVDYKKAIEKMREKITETVENKINELNAEYDRLKAERQEMRDRGRENWTREEREAYDQMKADYERIENQVEEVENAKNDFEEAEREVEERENEVELDGI